MKKWTKEKCIEEINKYEYLKDFRVSLGRAYKVVNENNWMSEIGSHLKETKKPIKWTYDKVKKIALKYSRRVDFSRNDYNVYQTCVRNGWLDEICSHMGEKQSNMLIWSKEKCKKEANKYSYRKEFSINSINAYAAARHNGWLDEICSHMKYRYKPKDYWNDIEKCRIEALKYDVKTDFINNSQHCYNMSLKNGFIDEITKHMVAMGDRYNKCVYSYEFSDNHVYVGLTYNIEVRKKNRERDKKDAVTIHIKKTGLKPVIKQLTDYIPVDDAIRLEGEYLNKYITEGWIKLNRFKTGGIGGSSKVWNYKRVKKIAKDYKTIDDFKNNDNYLYIISKRNGWLNNLFG